jgi:hypothetical protein
MAFPREYYLPQERQFNAWRYPASPYWRRHPQRKFARPCQP